MYCLYCFSHFSITRTFASGKTEKMVMQCLKDLGFPSGKVINYSKLSAVEDLLETSTDVTRKCSTHVWAKKGDLKSNLRTLEGVGVPIGSSQSFELCNLETSTSHNKWEITTFKYSRTLWTVSPHYSKFYEGWYIHYIAHQWNYHLFKGLIRHKSEIVEITTSNIVGHVLSHRNYWSYVKIFLSKKAGKPKWKLTEV